MKKILLWALIPLCLLLSCAHAEGLPEAAAPLIPPGAILTDSRTEGALRVESFLLESGEHLELAWDGLSGNPVFLTTIVPASFADEIPVGREAAEMLVQAVYPGRILFSSDAPGGKTLYLLSDALAGEVTVCAGGILSRKLTCGVYARNGILTTEGALTALKLHRPEAEFHEPEPDEDDGLLLYEGDAWVGGMEYEYELDARTGRLLEWERD